MNVGQFGPVLWPCRPLCWRNAMWWAVLWGTLAMVVPLALAVADHYDSRPGIALHERTARGAGLSLD